MLVFIFLKRLVFNRFGSDYLKREFLAPSISGDYVSCLGVSEVGSGSDVASEFKRLHSVNLQYTHRLRDDAELYYFYVRIAQWEGIRRCESVTVGCFYNEL